MTEKIFDNIYYLNIEELKKVCDLLKFSPFFFVEKNGKLKKERVDKKITIIKNILKVIEGKLPTISIIPENVTNYNVLSRVSKNDLVYYGQYVSTNKKILKLMKKLTNGSFKFGVISHDILYKYWKKGILLTYEELANEYLESSSKIHPEWKYIEYIRENGTREGWEKHRSLKANEVLKLIKDYIR